MLKELTKDDWLTILGVPESRVPAALILRGTRNFRSKYQAMLPYFDNVLEVGAPNGIVEDVLIGDVGGRPVGFACVYGASMASELVHIFGVLGTRAVIQIGNCGALADDFGAGDLFVAERAYCGEGAARYYKSDGPWVSASASLQRSRLLAGLRTGAIYTTAALFAEGEADVERWFREGFAAVDMETAATYAVAGHFGMDRVALLYGFDNPRRREHLLLSDADKEVRRAAADDRMKRLALDLAAEVGTVGEGVRIDYLADHPTVAPALAGWHHREWADLLPGWSPEEALAELRTHTGRRQVPTTFVAVAEGRVVGSASLLTADLDGWEHLSPWLASVYVLPEWRGHRVGRRLVNRAVEEARALGIATVYLWTAGQREYYARMGWEFVAWAECHGREVAVMRRETVF